MTEQKNIVKESQRWVEVKCRERKRLTFDTSRFLLDEDPQS